MKRILIEMDILFLGGSEKQFRNIISALDKMDECEVHVLIENKSLVGDSQLVDEFVKENSRVSFHFMNSCAMRFNHSFTLLRYMTKAISLFHLFFWHSFILPRLCIDVAMINNMTGLMMVPSLKRKVGYVVYNERNTGKQVTNRPFKVSLLRKCDRIIANSKAGADYLGTVIGKKVDVYKNGLLIENMLPAKEDDGVFRILLPGRINPIKNQLYVVRALNNIPNANYKLILAGGVEDAAYESQIVRYIQLNHLQEKIELLGFVSDMKAEYQKADLIILPSLEEGTPNVLLEAYMYGRLTLCSDIIQNVDCTVEKKSLFPLDDEKKLTDILTAVISNCYFEDAESVIEKNAEFVKKNYSMDNMTTAYRNLFMDGEIK